MYVQWKWICAVYPVCLYLLVFLSHLTHAHKLQVNSKWLFIFSFLFCCFCFVFVFFALNNIFSIKTGLDMHADLCFQNLSFLEIEKSQVGKLGHEVWGFSPDLLLRIRLRSAFNSRKGASQLMQDVNLCFWGQKHNLVRVFFHPTMRNKSRFAPKCSLLVGPTGSKPLYLLQLVD